MVVNISDRGTFFFQSRRCCSYCCKKDFQEELVQIFVLNQVLVTQNLGLQALSIHFDLQAFIPRNRVQHQLIQFRVLNSVDLLS